MVFDGETLEIEVGATQEELLEVVEFVRTRMEYIENIRLDGTLDTMETSSMLSFLQSIKRSNPKLPIEGFDTHTLQSQSYGQMSWK